jgi:hypothetical protein
MATNNLNKVAKPISETLRILWRIDPLLGKDLETDYETTTVAMQRCGKHTYTTIE